MNPTYTEPVWTEFGLHDLDWQGPHAFYRVHHNQVTGHYQLGRRLLPDKPIHLVGTFATQAEAQDAAVRREASL
jgi:hypothetical protein